MAAGTEYAQEYQQAQKAYVQGNYEEAAEIVDRLIKEFPEDPSASLLRGHVYCYGLQQFAIAKDQYQSVLGLTADQEFINYANDGLAYINSQAGAGNEGEAEWGGAIAPEAYAPSEPASPSATNWDGADLGLNNLGLDNEFDNAFGADDLSFDPNFDSTSTQPLILCLTTMGKILRRPPKTRSRSLAHLLTVPTCKLIRSISSIRLIPFQ